MAQSIEQLAELIQKRFYGGQVTQDAKVTIPQIELHILAEYNAILTSMSERISGGQALDGDLFVTYEDIPVLEDTKRGVYYSILPTRVASLPSGMGIFSIRPIQGFTSTNKNEFVRIAPGAWSLLPFNLEGYIGYEFVGEDRVNYMNMTPTNKVAEVMMQLIPADLSDESKGLNVSPEMEATIIRNVLDLLIRTTAARPFDNANDNQ